MTNAICHIEVPVRDMAAAKKFYSDLFGWRFNQYSEHYEFFNAGEGVGGGFFKSDDGCSGPQHVRFTVEVQDVGEMIQRVQQAGGEVVRQPQTIDGYGTFALVSDVSGNVLGLRTTPRG